MDDHIHYTGHTVNLQMFTCAGYTMQFRDTTLHISTA